MQPHSWDQPDLSRYPPLPAPSEDELAFLSEVALLGDQWNGIEQERALRAQEIESRIATARLEAALPQFSTFALGNTGTNSSIPPPPPPPSQPLPPPAHRAYSNRGTSSGYQQANPAYQPPLPLHPSTSTSTQYDQPPLSRPLYYQQPSATSGSTRYDDQAVQYEANAQGWNVGTSSSHSRPVVDSRSNWTHYEQNPQAQGMVGGIRGTTTQGGSWYPADSTQPRYVSEHRPSYPLPSNYPSTNFDPHYIPQPTGATAAYPLESNPTSSYQSIHRNSAPAQLSHPSSFDPLSSTLPQQGWHGPAALDSTARYHEPWQRSLPPAPSMPSTLPYTPSLDSTTFSDEHSRQSSATTVDFAAANEQLRTNVVRDNTIKRGRFDSTGSSSRPTVAHSGESDPRSQVSSSSLQGSTSNPGPTRNTTEETTQKSSTKKAPTARRGTRQKVDVHVNCVSCGIPIARLVLRGQKHELEVQYQAVFHCLNCSTTTTTTTEDSPISGTDVDREEGSPYDSSSNPPSDRRPSITTQPAAVPTTFRKKNKRLDVGATLTACDVCLMDRATGSVLPLVPESGQTINFQIEVVCVSCDSKYKLCSDCGGGGGVRLGTGKWRSKELFKDGKRTCSLRHQRLGAFPEMEYQVWKNTDLPRDEVEEISRKCGEMFANQMLGAIAIPEVLERNGAIWTSYAEAESHAKSGWLGMDPMIRYDIEPVSQIRRYLALRLCAPNLRKTSRKPEVEPPAPSIPNGKVLRGDKEIVGYIIAEWDQRAGTLFLALVIPWDATGESYDATTLLLQALCSRVQQDQIELNQQRYARGEPPVPKLQRVFTMIFFKTGSRMITQLTKKRGFAPLDEFLQSNPDVDPAQFPPYRPIYLPVPRQAGWSILVRNLREHADGRIDDWSARRSADEERGKRKEVRAKAARMKKANVEEAGTEIP